MTAKELIADFRLMGSQDLTVIFGYLGDHLHDCTLADGRPLSNSDLIGMKEFFRELSIAALNRESTKVQPAGELRTRPKVTGRVQEQPRYRSNSLECPVCGHVHQGDGECAQWIGQGRYCSCKLEVTA